MEDGSYCKVLVNHRVRASLRSLQNRNNPLLNALAASEIMLYFDYFQEDSLRGGDKLLSVLRQSRLDAQFLGCQQHMLPRDGDRLQRRRRLRVQLFMLRPACVPAHKDRCGLSIIHAGSDELKPEPRSPYLRATAARSSVALATP